MSEEVVTPEVAVDDKAEKTFTQADIDRIVEDRLSRERSKYTDYDDLKAKAEKSTQHETRAQELEKELNATKYSALKNQVALESGVPAKALVGTTEAELRASATELIEWRGEAKTPSPAKREVNQSGAAKSPEILTTKEQAAAALRNLMH